ncbi:response regulator [candidate division WWE3 bacterium]|uniref:Response regulator n=1 Tax=candidate division WWE3 bacterium TaxID=2053526 RepID=A0A7X9E6V3_UNCKA|nr:response regulator [candidate division WWE3 bacterium]
MQEENKKIKNNILIIEDEHDIRSIYVEVLNSAGYNVDEAGDGESGMNKIKNTDWNLLLLDIMLPGRDGLKILKDLKENPQFKKGPVIALTNLNSENIIQEAFSSGADGYLIKSEVTPDKVIEEVGKVLGKE